MAEEAKTTHKTQRASGMSSAQRAVLATHSHQIADIIHAIGELKKVVQDLANKEMVRTVEDRHIDERFDRIEERLDGITSLGRWILGAFGSTFIAAVAAFIAGGGLSLVG